MAADRMTPEEALERLEVDIADLLEESTGHDILTLAQIIVGHVLNALDPAEIGARWTPEQWAKALEGGERAGRVTLTDEDDETTVWLMRPGSAENAP